MYGHSKMEIVEKTTTMNMEIKQTTTIAATSRYYRNGAKRLVEN